MKTKFFFLFISVSQVFYSQTGMEVLKKVQSKFNSIQSFSASFNLIYYEADGKGGSKTSGKFFYKRKNKFVVEQKNSIITSNGETIWNYDKSRKRVVISYFTDDPTSFSIERYVFDYPSQCRVRLSIPESTTYEKVVILIPKDEQIDFQETKLWVNTDNFISKMEVIDLVGTKFSFSFSDILENTVINESRFTFHPPKGIQIIDLR
jgi:outer membrane lipoprotein carrier protein